MNLVPRALLYVESVATIGSIQGASRHLGISASAIDRQILQLEDAAGLRLFERHSSGMTMTKAGEMLVVMARRWRNEGSDFWSEIQQMQGVDLGHVRIAVMDSLVNGLLPDFIEKVAASYPRVQLELEVLTPSEAVQALDQGAVDMALAFNVASHRAIRSLWSEALPLGCVVAPDHPLGAETSVTLRQVVEYPFVLQSQALSIRKFIEANHDWVIHEGRQPVSTNSLQLLKNIVRRGSHVSITSEFDVAAELATGQLSFVPISDAKDLAQSISLIASATRGFSTVAQNVLEILKNCAKDTMAQVRPSSK